MSNLVILGTARPESDTLRAVKTLCPFSDYEIIDLRVMNIRQYGYEHNPMEDDFEGIARKMLSAENIAFATPVYWYAMSGYMEIFFDRLTELMYAHKSIGKGLAGKKVFLIASGSEDRLPEGFEIPFQRTATYFGMTFEGTFYQSVR